MQKFIRRFLPIIICMLFLAVLLILPDRFAGRGNEQAERCFGEILSKEDAAYRIRLMNGTFEGMAIFADVKETDNYKKGDTVVLDMTKRGDTIEQVEIRGYERVNMLLFLVLLTLIIVIVCLGVQAFKGILIAAVIVAGTWKLVIPWSVTGIHMTGRMAFICLAFAFVIFSMLYGFGRKFLLSFGSSLAGILVSYLFLVFFVDSMSLTNTSEMMTLMNLGGILLFAGILVQAKEKDAWAFFLILSAMLLSGMAQVSGPAVVLWQQGATLYELVDQTEIMQILLQVLCGIIGVAAEVPAYHGISWLTRKYKDLCIKKQGVSREGPTLISKN